MNFFKLIFKLYDVKTDLSSNTTHISLNVIQDNIKASLLFSFQNELFRNMISGIPSDWQTVRFQIRPDFDMTSQCPNCLQMLSTDDPGR